MIDRSEVCTDVLESRGHRPRNRVVTVCGWAAVAPALLLHGCFLEAPLAVIQDSGSRDSSIAEADAGSTVDAGPLAPDPDSGALDSGAVDAGAGPNDAGPDAGPVCAPETCEGSLYITCNNGQRVEEQCEQACEEGVGCVVACDLTVEQTIDAEGAYPFDTCGGGDDAFFLDEGCTRTNRTGPDRIVRLRVSQAADYRFELRREESPTDPVLYLRTDCDDIETELACDDDGAGSVHSRIDQTLEPGDYYLVLDTFRDDDEELEDRCGVMNLSVEIL